ncbi:MAG: DMT family transporter [Desulfohalobiaceae bacterium]|nr:DMT family transporter [Desulfohalobiaceae bacterium]
MSPAPPLSNIRNRLPSPAPLAAVFVVLVGGVWGLYWFPLRKLEALAAAGPWTTLAVVLTGCLCLAPFAWSGRYRLAASSNRALASIALGGASFVLYSDGLLYGQVAVVILFFYLTPVWSTLIVRFWLKWPVSAWRYAAIASGLLGIALVLRDSHPGGLPLPKTLGDLLGLASGLLWSIASTGMFVHSRTRPAETNFVFCAGAAAMAAVLAVVLGPLPKAVPARDFLAVSGWTLLLGGFCWALSLTAFMWVTRILEPARIGILLMSEVIVGAVSAALFTDEPFSPIMAAGAVLVIAAGFLESMSGLSLRKNRFEKGVKPNGHAPQRKSRTFF